MVDENTIKTVGVEGGIPIANWVNQIGKNSDWKTALRTAGLYGFDRDVKFDANRKETTLTFNDKSVLKLIGEDEFYPTESVVV